MTFYLTDMVTSRRQRRSMDASVVPFSDHQSNNFYADEFSKMWAVVLTVKPLTYR